MVAPSLCTVARLLQRPSVLYGLGRDSIGEACLGDEHLGRVHVAWRRQRGGASAWWMAGDRAITVIGEH